MDPAPFIDPAGEERAPTPGLDELEELLASRRGTVCVLGLGVVGLPLAVALHGAGYDVLGFDTDADKVARLEAGERVLRHLPRGPVEAMLASPRFAATTDPRRLSEARVFLLCVPTPLDAERQPDLSAIEDAARAVARALRPGSLVVLESTTWPGTTREVVAPLLVESGLELGREVALAYSPEREDPGDPQRSAARIPKLVAGLDARASQLARALYECFVPEVHEVATPEIAEAAKLLENTYRAVNIALVNELKLALDAMGIDVWQVIDAAATKPFGFQRFTPGPGMGGHCIPIDPFYLAWAARRAGATARFVELAGEINRAMPARVVERAARALEERGVAVHGARVLVLGIAYKPEVESTYESPALELVRGLAERGARVRYADPWVPAPPLEIKDLLDSPAPVDLDADTVASFDLVLLATDHRAFDPALIADHARLVVDTRHALADRMSGDPRYVTA